MFDHKALAVLVAALDGTNPNITHQPDGTITLTTGRGRSDLALATEDLLADRMPAVAVRDVANAALAVAMCTAATLGAPELDIDPKAIAAEMRFVLRSAALEAEQ